MVFFGGRVLSSVEFEGLVFVGSGIWYFGGWMVSWLRKIRVGV